MGDERGEHRCTADDLYDEDDLMAMNAEDDDVENQFQNPGSDHRQL